MKLRLGAVLGALAGGAAGFALAGPGGAAAGAAKGAALAGAGAASGFAMGHGVDTANHAERTSKREALVSGEHTRNAINKADRVAKDSAAANERALQKISASRVRASARRVRGGLFGDTSGPQYSPASSKLGG